ncbi:hypothetical protein HY949_04535 [Candidatus Gottesmanbacteria bacterium]|nr:hypothetical protein [Candidatus Gottesmanbacteria bacterium]
MKPIIFLFLAVVLFGGLFFVLKPSTEVQNLSKKQNQVPVSKVKTFEIIVKGKKIASNSDTMNVTEGDTVMMKITADEDEEFHLHGYDKSVDLEKDKPTEFSLTANLTGRFIIELEKSKTDIGALEVSPK